MKDNVKLLKFASDHIEMPNVKPAKKFIPNWYKGIKGWNENNIQFDNFERLINVKSCMPFLDSLTSGYMVELWVDVHVSGNNDNKSVVWANEPAPISLRKTEDNLIPIPAGHSNQHFIWKTKNIIKLPKGYSALIVHPLNRFDLPFTTLSGVVDKDFTQPEGNLPFFIKNDFSGVIPAGTPIYQVIPFKRENWKAVEDLNILIDAKKMSEKSRRKFYGYYKNNVWNKKTYE